MVSRSQPFRIVMIGEGEGGEEIARRARAGRRTGAVRHGCGEVPAGHRLVGRQHAAVTGATGPGHRLADGADRRAPRVSSAAVPLNSVSTSSTW